MKIIKSWMTSNPFKVVFCSSAFTLLAAIAAVRDDWFAECVVLYLLLVIAWTVGVWRHGRAMAVVLLTALSINAAKPQKQEAVAIGVGVVVICVGGVCIYKVVKFCQKKFPPKGTNAPTELSMAFDEYAGAYEYSSMGSCYSPIESLFPFEDLNQNPTTFTLSVEVGSGGAQTSMAANNSEGSAQTWDQFRAEMADHGLYLTGHSSYRPQFSINGSPCDPALSPFEFSNSGRVTHRGQWLRKIVIERSTNLVDWYPLLETDVAVGSRFQVIDTTREGQMFYRTTNVSL